MFVRRNFYCITITIISAQQNKNVSNNNIPINSKCDNTIMTSAPSIASEQFFQTSVHHHTLQSNHYHIHAQPNQIFIILILIDAGFLNLLEQRVSTWIPCCRREPSIWLEKRSESRFCRIRPYWNLVLFLIFIISRVRGDNNGF